MSNWDSAGNVLKSVGLDKRMTAHAKKEGLELRGDTKVERTSGPKAFMRHVLDKMHEEHVQKEKNISPEKKERLEKVAKERKKLHDPHRGTRIADDIAAGRVKFDPKTGERLAAPKGKERVMVSDLKPFEGKEEKGSKARAIASEPPPRKLNN